MVYDSIRTMTYKKKIPSSFLLLIRFFLHVIDCQAFKFNISYFPQEIFGQYDTGTVWISNYTRKAIFCKTRAQAIYFHANRNPSF